MPRLAFVGPEPDASRVRADLEAVGAARGIEVANLPSSSSPEALSAFGLVVYEIPDDFGSAPVYLAALATPGLVVFPDPGTDSVMAGVLEVDEEEAEAAILESEMRIAARERHQKVDLGARLRLARISIGVVVDTERAKAALEAMGCRTPVFAGPDAIGRAVDWALLRSDSPVRRALARWGMALAAVGVTPEQAERGLGARYADGVEALTRSEQLGAPRS